MGHPMRRRRWLIAGIVALAVVAALSWVAFDMFVEQAKPFDEAYWLPDVAIIPWGAPDSWNLGGTPGRHILQLHRGHTASTVTTGHGWSETVTMELGDLQPGDVVDLADERVRVSFLCLDGYSGWDLKPGSARGALHIKAISDEGVAVSYDLTLTALNTPVLDGETYEKEVTFKGDRLFRRHSLASLKPGRVGSVVQEGSAPDEPDRPE